MGCGAHGKHSNGDIPTTPGEHIAHASPMSVSACAPMAPASQLPPVAPSPMMALASPDGPTLLLPPLSYEPSTRLVLSGGRKRRADDADSERAQREDCSRNKRCRAGISEGVGDDISDVSASEETLREFGSLDTDDEDGDDEGIVDALLGRWTIVSVAS